jgi:hypothetical protein
MVYMKIFVYGIVAIILALFATYLALQRPRGPEDRNPQRMDTCGLSQIWLMIGEWVQKGTSGGVIRGSMQMGLGT